MSNPPSLVPVVTQGIDKVQEVITKKFLDAKWTIFIVG